MPDAGIELKRVVDLVTQSEVDSGVYTLIDSTTGAVKKYPLGSFIASVAPIFDSTAAYTAGSYCNYNGQIYKFTADHAAGSWTGSDATAVNVGGELTDLKADLNNVDRVLDISWTLGSINRDNGATTDANDRLRTNMFVGIYPYLKIAKETTNRVILEIFKYNSNGTYVNYQYVVVNDGLTIGYKFDSDYKYIIVSRSTTEQITFTESNGLILWANGSISSGNVNPYSTNTITANEFSVSESCILVVSVPNCRVDLTYYSNGTYIADLSYRDDGNKKAYFLLSPSYTYRLYAYTEDYSGVSAELVNIPASQVYIGGMYNGIVISSTGNNRSNLINAEHNRYVMIWATVTSVVHKYKNGLYIGTSTVYPGVFSPAVAYIGDCDAFYITTNGLSDIFWILTNDSPLY